MPRIVVGADLCQGAWAAIRLGDGRFDRGAVCSTLAEVTGDFGREASVIAIDIPLSYPIPGSKGRLCEQEGRKLLGPRRSSMFDTYPLGVLQASSHAQANALAVQTIGCGLSQQSFGLRHAIKEAIALSEKDARLHETHPEMAFAHRVGVFAGKKSWTGFRQRLEALEAAGIHLPIQFPEMDRAAMDDILDAACAAWVADLIAVGKARRVPLQVEEPAIWC